MEALNTIMLNEELSFRRLFIMSVRELIIRMLHPVMLPTTIVYKAVVDFIIHYVNHDPLSALSLITRKQLLDWTMLDCLDIYLATPLRYPERQCLPQGSTASSVTHVSCPEITPSSIFPFSNEFPASHGSIAFSE